MTARSKTGLTKPEGKPDVAVEVFGIRGTFDLLIVWSLPVPFKMDSGDETSFIEKGAI